MNEGIDAYSQMREGFVGPDAEISEINKFDREYDDLAAAIGDEEARKFVFDSLRETEPAAYGRLMTAMQDKMRKERLGDTDVPTIHQKVGEFQQQTGPDHEKKTF